jgi:hypothetical protein
VCASRFFFGLAASMTGVRRTGRQRSVSCHVLRFSGSGTRWNQNSSVSPFVLGTGWLPKQALGGTLTSCRALAILEAAARTGRRPRDSFARGKRPRLLRAGTPDQRGVTTSSLESSSSAGRLCWPRRMPSEENDENDQLEPQGRRAGQGTAVRQSSTHDLP